MPPQVTLEIFSQALAEMGHDPKEYEGKRLRLDDMAMLYEIKTEHLLEAVARKHLHAHYDYRSDTIWVDALEAAHFHYCLNTEAHLYSPNRLQDKDVVRTARTRHGAMAGRKR